jgi:hypothetical protein
MYIAFRQTIWLKIFSETQPLGPWKSRRNGFLYAIVNHKKNNVFSVSDYIFMETPTHICLKYVSISRQLESVRGNTDGVASCRFHYESCLQGIHAKQINIHENTTQQIFSPMSAEIKSPPGNGPYCFWIQDRFNIWSHSYIQMRQKVQDMDNFVFWIMLKQQQNGLKTSQTEGVWQK